MILNEIVLYLLLTFVGAACGAALALAFVQPKTFRGFVRRVGASLIGGVVFGSYIRDWAGFSDDWEGQIAGACLAGFASWWVGAFIIRSIREWEP